MLQSLKLPALEGALTATLYVSWLPGPNRPPVSMVISAVSAAFLSLHQVPTGLVAPEALTLLHFQFKLEVPVFLITIVWVGGVELPEIAEKRKDCGVNLIMGAVTVINLLHIAHKPPYSTLY